MNRVNPRRGQPRRSGATALAFLVVILAIVSVPAASGVGTAAPVGSAAPAAPTASPAPTTTSTASPPAHAGPTPGAATPASMTVSPTSGPAGTLVNLSAAHFADGSSFTVDFGSTEACSGETTSKGYFNCSYSIPNMQRSVLKFVGTDAKGHTADANFSLLTYLTTDPTAGLVGTTVVLHGSGFGGGFFGKEKTPVGFPVEIKWSGGTVCYNNTTAYAEFNCTFRIPASAAGGFAFHAISLNLSLDANATFNVTSGLSAGPTFGPDGTRIIFTGTGFGAAATVWVNWSAGNACEATVSGTGGFSCQYTIPGGTAGGAYTFTATDSDKDKSTAAFEVSYLAATPLGGPVGTTINFTAGGFTPLVPLNITWGGGTACSGGITTATGTYTCLVVLPPAVAGAHTFTAEDSDGLVATTVVTIQPALAVSPGYGAPGRTLGLNGTGFGDALAYTVTDPNGTVCSGTTSAVGSFGCTYLLPLSTAGGPVPFVAEDAGSNLASASYDVTSLTVAPASGTVNTEANFTGSGYAPNAAFTIKWGSTQICSGTTNASGTFRCVLIKPFRVPWAVVGPHIISASDGSDGDSATAVFTVTPGLGPSPTSVTSGTSIKFNASGFAATSTVTVTWMYGTACSGVTSALGSTNCSYVLPAVPNGAYVFTATDSDGHTVNATVTVGPQLLLTPSSGPVGTVVAINATGFSPSVALTITSTLGTACAGTTTAAGAYACSYTIPATPSAAYQLTATDANSHHAIAHYSVTPVLYLDLAAGPVGSVLTFSGTGFAASHPVNVSWSGGLACAGVSSTLGSFSCLFAVPGIASGTYEFTARDTPAGSDVATQNFTVDPSLAVDPTSGPVGTDVTFSGAGYAAVTMVAIGWSGGTVCSVSTGTTGAFTCGYVIAPTSAGAHLFTGLAANGASAETTFTVAPILTPTPSTGPVGTVINFNGSGFAPDASVAVSWSGGLGCTATTSAAGSFNCSMTMPAAPYGPTEFTATDGYTASTNFTVVPQLAPNPTAALDGASITFTGTGFTADVTVNVTWGSGTACAGTTDADGSFSCGFTIPVGTPGGLYPFTATDADGHSAISSVTVATKLTVGPGRGDVPVAVTFNGTGFGADAAVFVNWTGGTACSTTTSGTGTFSCGYTIPSGTAGGNYTFTAKDADDNTASTRFVVTFLTTAPTGAVAGTTVHFAAGGFAPNSSFAITWTDGTACSGTTTASGSFACAYAIPTGTAPGPYTFTAKDGFGSTATASFDVFGVPTVTGVAPNRTGVDIDQPVKFTATVSGGSGTYTTYAWLISATALGCAVENTASIVCDPTTVGNYNVSVAVTDTDDVTSARVTSPNLTVSPDPTVNKPTANLTAADVGQSVTFSVVAGGGNGTLAYRWNGLPTGCSGSAPTIVCVPSAPVTDARVSVTVTDANDFSVTSASISFNVSVDPTISAPGANRTSADVGQSVTFSVTASGGAGSLSFVWSGLPSGCASTTSVVTCSPSAAVLNAEITATVIDGNGFHVTSAALTFTVYADPVVTTPTASHPSVDLGESVEFSTTGSDGYGTLSFAWANLPASCAGTTAEITCTPSATESGASITVTVTDANGFAVTSAALTFSVYSDPTASKPTASAPGADLGQSVDFTASVGGGSGDFTFVWTDLPTGCSGTTEVVDCADLGTMGSFTVSFKVTDSNGYSATSGSLAFVVDADPSVGAPAANVSSADVGQDVNFSVTASSGAGGFTYTWNGLPSGCAGTGAFVDCAPTAAATQAMISVTVTDLNGFGLTSTPLVFTVYADPSVSPPTATPHSADVGQSVTFATVLSGGAGAPSFTWSGLPTGCSVTGATATCDDLPTATTLDISVAVVDANGFKNSSTVTDFTVLADPTASPVTASAASVDVGQAVTFSTTVTGGAGGYTYVWSGLPTGCSGTTNPLICTPTAEGAASVSVKVTDGNGVSVTATATAVTVYTDPSVSLGVTPSSLLLGKSIFLHGLVANGSGGFSYSWSGLPGGCSASTGATISCTPSSAGTFTVELTVKDSDGRSASANVTVTVNSSFLGLPAVEGEAIVGAVIALALIGLLVFVAVRRRRRPTSSSPVPWGPTTPGAPPASPTPAPAPEPAWSPPPPVAPPAPEESPSWEMPPAEPEAPGAPESTGPGSLPSEDHSA
ncbi:MAG TPA: hypothetical protein VMG36_07365 [Thermoplasmata archaeon]|nr:hypothetical protein [Thermoplasmata archaeon]